MDRLASFGVALTFTCALFLAGCGASGGGGTTGGTDTDDGTGTTGAGSPSISLSLVDQATEQETDTISAIAPGTINATVKDANGNRVSDLLVTATTTIGNLNPATGEAVTDSNGHAEIGLSAGSDTGAGTVTVTATVGGETVTRNIAFTIGTTVEQIPTSISFVSANPTAIGLQGSGRPTSAIITFNVTDQFGNPMNDVDVNFILETDTVDLSLVNTSATTDPDGDVLVVVQAGTVPTTVSVRASVTVDADTTITANSLNLVVSTGVPDQDSMSLSVETFNPEGWSFDGTETTLTIRLADHANNPVADGYEVLFTTEGGSITPSCTTVNGACTVTWTSQAPRPLGFEAGSPPPDRGFVTILARAVGEETFIDNNNNYRFDSGDTFSVIDYDLDEPFRDDWANGIFDAGLEEFFEIDPDGTFDVGNGIFDGGSSCSTAGETAGICTKELVYIWRLTEIVMSGSNPTITFSPTVVDVSAGAQTVSLTIMDVNENVMPAGTTITLQTTNGRITSTSSFEIPSTTAEGPNLTEFSFIVDTEATPNTTFTGVLTCTVTTPRGITTTAAMIVND